MTELRTSREQWEAMAADLTINGRAFINGEYTDAASGETFECRSPIDNRALAQVASCDQADVDQAVANARATFESRAWSGMAPAARKQVMIKLAALLMEHKDELALLETLDMGKPISDSLSVDIPAAARSLSWSGEAIDKVYDEVAPTPDNEIGMITREPIGVVGAIVPLELPTADGLLETRPGAGHR